MGVSVRTEGNVAIVELRGEFTLGKSGVSRPLDLHGHRLEDLGQTLRGLVERGFTRIVLDLDGVRFLDSAGLGELVAWKKRTTQLGGDLRLLRPHDRVREVLELTTLMRVFQVFDAEADAVASFR
ncbi:MAG TPA: STAS domain-containing protein [Candidatus Sulfotelmatobacter sp.]|jgi:anti-sigma B factor antagonist|nr:STAS domain-containing protein [Candidatus Sulfotelmatobacter sp.]